MPDSPGGFGKPDGPRQCTAISKRSGKRCMGPAVATSTTQKCRMHGGFAGHAIGPNNPGFKDGRHSKYLPSQLDSLYKEALSNPELIEMADHIALLEAKIKEVLLVTKSGDPAPRWGEVREAFEQLETSILSSKQDEVVAGLEAMHQLFDAGQKWDRAWKQVVDLMEQLRKMTDTEVKRKKELNQMVPVERVVILMAAVAQAVKRNVTNPQEIRAVYKELAMLHGSDHTAPGEGTRPRLGPEVIDVQTVRPKRDRNVTSKEAKEGNNGHPVRVSQ